MAKEKIVLAYSGGLDTSIILTWLKEQYDCDVIAVCCNAGQSDDFDKINQKALATGASKSYVLDIQEEFITDYIWPTLKAGAVYENDYLLGTSMARPLMAKKLVEIANQEGAYYIVHGCTGKGNDRQLKRYTAEMKTYGTSATREETLKTLGTSTLTTSTLSQFLSKRLPTRQPMLTSLSKQVFL